VRTASGKAFSIRFLTKATRTDIAKKSINKKCAFALELEQENLQDYIEVRNLLKTWKHNGVNMSHLDSNAIGMLKPFALNNNKAAAMSISVLKQNGQSAYIYKLDEYGAMSPIAMWA